MARKKLGDVLRSRGHISEDALSEALQEQQRTASLLGELLLHRGTVPKQDLVAAIEEVTKVRYVDCAAVEPASDVLKLLSHALATKHCALPVEWEGDKVVAVMAEPQNLRAVDELRFAIGKPVSPRFGFRSEILDAISRHYPRSGAPAASPVALESLPRQALAAAAEMEFISASTGQKNRDAIREFQSELRTQPTPAVQLVSSAIAAAIGKNASDIHMEPQASAMMVRLRVDGVLRECMKIPEEHVTSVTSRVKILADMDIAQRRNPQDGRVLVKIGPKKLDLRVSTLPTHYGEKIVIRLLDPKAPQLLFPDLGISPESCDLLQRLLETPQGMVLVTGPTGSGKTTTLYAALNQLRSPMVNITTVEDPVEYMLEGINQVQVNTKAGLTFAKCLRSILRQDPNIIMVGEIRDAETAEIALKAAQTGHLVLTTVHTNDSIAAVHRLLDLDVPAFLIASSVTAIMAQRLVRKLCHCRVQKPITPEFSARLAAAGITRVPELVYSPVGCKDCDNTGYRGRIGVFEILAFDEPICSAIRSTARPEEIRSLARRSGMRQLQDEAMEKAASGLTTLEELLRVIPFERTPSERCEACGRGIAETFLYCPFCGTPRPRESSDGNKNGVYIPVGSGGNPT